MSKFEWLSHEGERGGVRGCDGVSLCYRLSFNVIAGIVCSESRAPRGGRGRRSRPNRPTTMPLAKLMRKPLVPPGIRHLEMGHRLWRLILAWPDRRVNTRCGHIISLRDSVGKTVVSAETLTQFDMFRPNSRNNQMLTRTTLDASPFWATKRLSSAWLTAAGRAVACCGVKFGSRSEIGRCENDSVAS